jgi:hypothetical protein
LTLPGTPPASEQPKQSWNSAGFCSYPVCSWHSSPCTTQAVRGGL